MSKTSNKSKVENLIQWLKVRKSSPKPKIFVYGRK